MAKILVKNNECLALIDTGSEVNAVDKNLIAEHNEWGQVYDSEASLTGVGKEKVSTHGKVLITFTFAEDPKNEMTEEFEILEDLDGGFILGSGFLRKHEISVQNYTKNSYLWKPSNATQIKLQIPENDTDQKINVILKQQRKQQQENLQMMNEKSKKIISVKYSNKNDLKMTSPKSVLYSKENSCLINNARPTAKIIEGDLWTDSEWNLEEGAEITQWIKVSSIDESNKNGETMLIEPLKSNRPENVLISRALVKAKEGSIPLKILNLKIGETKINKHTKIAKIKELRMNEYTIEKWDQDSEPKVIGAPTTKIMITTDEQIKEALTKILDENSWLKEINIGTLTDKQKYEAYKLLNKHKEAFSQHENDIGRTDLMEVKINLDKKEPIKTKQYPVPPHKREILKEQVQKFKDLKVIQPSTSAYNSPTVLVTKADKSYRLCIDFRNLNEHTIKEAVPLINFEEASQLLASNKFFTSLDLYSGYLQLPLEKSSQEKTAFTVGNDHYEFNCLPFGVTNGVANFQNLMNIIFGDIQMDKIMCYLDDILIIAKSFDDHLARLDIVLERLVKAKLKLKPKKCNVLKTELTFLGMVVSVNGIWPAERKIGAIQDFVVPKTRKQLRSFLGLTNFFKRFIDNYAVIAAPLYELTSDKTKFKWSEKLQEAFIKLKELLLCPPVLRHPDFKKKFHVWSDASLVGLGAVLTQEHTEGEHSAVAFASKKLTNTQSRYSVTELELLGVVFAIGQFSCYLQGRHFLIHTDHCPLTYLMNTKTDTKSRHFRWLLEIQSYEFTIVHTKGTDNSAADALSRDPAFIQNREPLKNDTINLLKKTPVDKTELYAWKNKINDQLGVNMKNEHPKNMMYMEECKDSLYQQISNILTHSLEFADKFREIIRKFEMRHRKYVDLAAPDADEDSSTHFKQIKSGAQATELEIVAVAGLLKIPIIYKNKNQTKVTLGGMHSDLEGFPPVGAALEFTKDQHGNWVWTNYTLEILEHDSSNRIERRSKNVKQGTRKKGDLLDPSEEIATHNGTAEIEPGNDGNCAICKINLLKENALYIPTVKEFIACQQEDEYCQAWTKYIFKKEQPDRTLIGKKEFNKLNKVVFIDNNGLLKTKWENPLKRGDRNEAEKIIIPQTMLKFVFQGNHDLMGHIGREKSLELITRKYYRPKLLELLSKYIKSCRKCANKSGNKGITKAPLGSFPLSAHRFASWNMDIMGPLAPSTQGSKYILSCIECYTRWLELIPLKDIKSETIARALLTNIISRFGIPYSLYSDRGANFRSDIMKKVYNVLGIIKKETLPYSPSSNGKVERSNLFVINTLRSMINEEQESWENHLPFVLLTYRASMHQFTGTTPAYLVYGCDLILPQNLMVDLPIIGKPGLETSQQNIGTEIALRLRKANTQYLKNLSDKVKTRNEKINENRKDIKVEIGDTVYLKRPFIKKPGTCEKLASKFVGPYRVIEKTGDHGFHIQEVGGRKCYVAHRNNITPSFLTLREEVEIWAKEGEKIIKELQLKEITPNMVLNFDTSPQLTENEEIGGDSPEDKLPKLSQQRVDKDDRAVLKGTTINPKKTTPVETSGATKQEKIKGHSTNNLIHPNVQQNDGNPPHKLRSGKIWKEGGIRPKRISILKKLKDQETTSSVQNQNLTTVIQADKNNETKNTKGNNKEMKLQISMKTQKESKYGHSKLITTEIVESIQICIQIEYSNDLLLNLSLPSQNKYYQETENPNQGEKEFHGYQRRIKICLENRKKPKKNRFLGHLLMPLSLEGMKIAELEIFYTNLRYFIQDQLTLK